MALLFKAWAEAADRHELAVGHDALEGRGGGRIELVHTDLLKREKLNDTT